MSLSPNHNIDKTSVYIAAGLISACGALMFNILPVFVGALSEEFGFSESQIGDVLAGFNVTFIIVAISAVFWIRSISWKIISVIGVVVSIAAFIAMAIFQSYIAIVAAIAMMGVGMGILYTLIMTILGDSQFPDRAFGLKLGLETIPGAICLVLIPTLILPAYGFNGMVLSMAGVLGLLALSIFWLPSQGQKNNSTVKTKAKPDKFTRSQLSALAPKGNLLAVLAVLSTFAFFTGVVSSWTFLDLLADTRGLPAQKVGEVLAIGFVICGLGGFVAAIVGTRWGRAKPFVLIILVALYGLYQLSAFNTLAGYTVGTCLFLFSINFTLAYTFGLTAAVDNSGKLVVLSAAVLPLGAIVGSLASGRVIEAYGYNGMLLFSGITIGVSLVIFLMVLFLQKQRL